MSKEAKKTAQDAEIRNEAESVYSVDELADAARDMFGTSPDIVRAALRMADMTESTVSAAKELVEKFRHKEVR